MLGKSDNNMDSYLHIIDWLRGPKYELLAFTIFVCFSYIMFIGLYFDGACDN